MSATYPECRAAAPRGQRGFALATAIFIVVVLAALAAFLLTVSNLEHGQSALDVQGARAHQGARAGVEWAAYRALRQDVCDASTSIALPGGLAGFTVTVECQRIAYAEGGSSGAVFQVKATACNQPSGGACPGLRGTFYVERQLQATVDSSS
jgi:MSHA biogenesis protein MshP